MGADSDTALRFTEVRIDPSATRSPGQHLVRSPYGCLRLAELLSFIRNTLVPRSSGLNSSLLGLIIVIGPVDSVDKPRSCRWGADAVWMTGGQEPGTTRPSCGSTPAIHRTLVARAWLPTAEEPPYTCCPPLVHSQRAISQNKRPQSYPQAVDQGR